MPKQFLVLVHITYQTRSTYLMNQLFHELNKRREYLKDLMREIDSQLIASPQGNLRVSKIKGIPRYYHMTKPGDTQGKYIQKKNKNLACQLAQKDYLQKLYREAARELESINIYLTNHKETDLENIYDGLNQYRKEIVTPLVITDEMYAEQWLKEPYQTNPYYLEEKVYPTKRDEMVRSKSEVMLADMYYELGIPYRYEAELRLKNGKRKYPDFTLFNTRTREVIYHEHLGLMDNEEYRQANFNKLDEYRRSGIYLGKNLIITYEGEGCYLNIKEIKQMIKQMFGK